jgi:hypothetical protein
MVSAGCWMTVERQEVAGKKLEMKDCGKKETIGDVSSINLKKEE